MEKEYYIKMNNEDFGPFTFDKVCSLGIFDTTFVSIPQDNAGWRMAKDIPELRGYTVIPETLTVESPETAHYYLREGTEIRGPYSLEEFALMEVKESDFVGINSTDKWYFAESITGLLPLLERILHSQLNQEQQSTANEIDDLYYVSLDGVLQISSGYAMFCAAVLELNKLKF